MQLNITTDYAIRIIVYLSSKKGIISSKELSIKLKIPQHYILKITKRLEKSGIINIYVGKNGGFSMVKKSNEISLADIIKIMEGTTKINRCLEEDKYCSCCASDYCEVRNFYCILQKEVEEKLFSMTIERLLSDLITKNKEEKEEV